MNDVLQFFHERLEVKEKELARRITSFRIFVETEINTDCFEQNAINELLNMRKLKTEINQLKFDIQSLEIKSTLRKK